MGPGADRNLSEKGRVLSADYVKDRIKPACHSGLDLESRINDVEKYIGLIVL
jgi:hypothetical protein